ncbi:MAG: Gfo/Idh/MocA family protein [Myxococcota bacterium]
MTQRIRYAQVGLGLRSWLFSLALAGRYAEHAELVGLCDANPGRLRQRLDWAASQGLSPGGFAAADFERMIEARRPDCVIVTPPDRDHAHYVCRAMELGCDVICEKPLTIDAPGLQRILDTRARTGRRCRVTFNYRYSPPRIQVKELLDGGLVGDVLSVDFHWLLDTRHGADYFRRWHRNKRNSGGLMVHKATHHFDLVNWWLSSTPTRVQASGARRFYTPANADALGLSGRSARCLDCGVSERCPFHLDLRSEGLLAATYLKHEEHDGYWRDRCVFDEGIDIEDTMNVLVDYAAGARMSYSLNAFMPREGYAIAFNGTRGRLDHVCVESSYVSGQSPISGALDRDATSLTFQPHFGKAEPIEVRHAEGSHGGGDDGLLADLFAPGEGDDPLGRRADHRAGAWSILTGIAANRAMETGAAVDVSSLVSGLESP